MESPILAALLLMALMGATPSTPNDPSAKPAVDAVQNARPDLVALTPKQPEPAKLDAI
jgi:hypothetical protein